MIILDSNQLRQAAPPDGPLLTLLRKLSDANGHTLAIPQMVLDEHLGYQEHEAQAEIARLEKSARQLSKLFREDIPSKIPHLDAADAATIRRESIEEIFKILPTPDGAEHDALIRKSARSDPPTPSGTTRRAVPA
jgi:hypothetical protein